MSEHAFVQLPARAGSADMQDLIKALAAPDVNKGPNTGSGRYCLKADTKLWGLAAVWEQGIW